MPPLFVFIVGALCGAIGIVFAAGVWSIVTTPIGARSSKRSPIVLHQGSGSLGNVRRESPSPSYGLGSSAARTETPHSELVDAPQRRAATEVPAPSFVRVLPSSVSPRFVVAQRNQLAPHDVVRGFVERSTADRVARRFNVDPVKATLTAWDREAWDSPEKWCSVSGTIEWFVIDTQQRVLA